MNALRHALLARRLIAACGGLNEAAADCRVSKTQLARFCDPKSGQFMPADVMAALQAYCGEPLYAQALVEIRPAEEEIEDLLTEVAETTESAAALQRLVREAAKDGRIDHEEDAAIEKGMLELEDQLRQVRAARERGRRA